MTIYTNTPYTYRIGWSKSGMNYYGVRYAANCHPSDLFVTYFTSSKYVADYIKEHGLPDIIEVRRTFTGEDRINRARLHENRVLKRMKVTSRPDYLNKSDLFTFDNHNWTVYDWVNLKTGNMISCCCSELYTRYSLNADLVYAVISGNRKSHRGWSIVGRPLSKNSGTHDDTIYTFINEQDMVEVTTRAGLCIKYDLDPILIGKVARGDRKIHKGWRLIDTPNPKGVRKSRRKRVLTVHSFRHDNGTEETCTSGELYTKYKLCHRALSKLIHRKIKSHRGWRLITPSLP